ncbi:hypothetical protein PVAP13_5NG274140 [Panicum virgatum]|uniref:Uncharacterized protein n=1 Tax=Panicum virgatum TaxID=38727 RepID=A0A8T0RZW4_PANVG|nr:hypothetical protein PVAP13_5NG274140 [Panicum virgatum]
MEGRELQFAGLGGGEEEAEESRSGSAAAVVAREGDVDPEELRSGSAAPAARGGAVCRAWRPWRRADGGDVGGKLPEHHLLALGGGPAGAGAGLGRALSGGSGEPWPRGRRRRRGGGGGGDLGGGEGHGWGEDGEPDVVDEEEASASGWGRGGPGRAKLCSGVGEDEGWKEDDGRAATEVMGLPGGGWSAYSTVDGEGEGLLRRGWMQWPAHIGSLPTPIADLVRTCPTCGDHSGMSSCFPP